jgi:regulator of protease activity HflC (stomatin/prohibitin superfamily)
MNKSTIVLIGTIMAALLAVAILMGSFFTVSAGQTGVLTRMGAVEPGIYSEGAHFKIPFFDQDHEVNTKTVTYTATNLDASTKDLQMVSSSMAVIYSVDAVDAPEVYRNYRDMETLEEKAIKPSIEEVMKSVTAKYTAEELITKREIVRTEIIALMRIKLKTHYVSVNDIAVTNFQFSPTYNQAIERKVTAEQNALTEQNNLQAITIRGEQAIATAKAQAEVIKVQAEAIQKQGGSEYIQLKFIEKWDGALPTYGTVPQLFKGIDK